MMMISEVFKKYKEVILYLIFGFLTTVVSLIVYYLLTISLLNPNDAVCLQIANIISWVCGVTFAYFTNRKYVFESKNTNRFKEATSFVSARIITLLLDMLLMGVGVSILRFNDKIMKIVSQFLVIVLNYVFSKLFVFRSDKNEKNDKK